MSINKNILVITPVGISSFSNAIKGKAPDLEQVLDDLDYRGFRGEKWEDREDTVKTLLNVFDRMHNAKKIHKSCAEIASIDKILQEHPDKEIVIQLLATDTPASVIAANSIKKWIEQTWIDRNIKVLFEEDLDKIEGLTIEDADQFEAKGADALLRRLTKITESEKKDKLELLINITGGYKVLTPWFTLFAQLKNVKLQYLYEEEEAETSKLLSIRKMPINFDLGETEFLLPYLNKADLRDTPLSKKFMNDKVRDRLISLQLIKAIDEDSYELTALGVLMYHYSKSVDLNRGNLGYFIELVLAYYYLLTAKYKDKDSLEYDLIKRGFNPKKDGVGDIDLLFCYQGTEKYILGEIKSIRNVRPSTNGKELYKQFIDKAKYLKHSGKQLKELALFVYTPTYMDIDLMSNYLNEIKEKIRLFNSELVFRVFKIVLPSKGDIYNVNTTKLLQENLKEESITEIKI